MINWFVAAPSAQLACPQAAAPAFFFLCVCSLHRNAVMRYDSVCTVPCVHVGTCNNT